MQQTFFIADDGNLLLVRVDCLDQSSNSSLHFIQSVDGFFVGSISRLDN